ncbi:hypothetical protein SDC9_95333 [bioreactor metagenome]|uniref:Uncharacterized protein n=1 Tax=bioreactor metagenome TaxID=1076179 RepID=A0A645A6A8_9ZZZZ
MLWIKPANNFCTSSFVEEHLLDTDFIFFDLLDKFLKRDACITILFIAAVEELFAKCVDIFLLKFNIRKTQVQLIADRDTKPFSNLSSQINRNALDRIFFREITSKRFLFCILVPMEKGHLLDPLISQSIINIENIAA